MYKIIQSSQQFEVSVVHYCVAGMYVLASSTSDRMKHYQVKSRDNKFITYSS